MVNVTLIAHTPEPEKVVACAAKLCYSNADSIETLLDGLTEDKVSKFISKLSNMGHQSPVEHVSFTFGIEGVSRALLAQVTRHRIASFSVQSQRYVGMEDFEYVTPPEIDLNERLNVMFDEVMKLNSRAYTVIKNELMQGYEDSGMAHSAAEKKANEDARFILPNAATTRMIVTMNARELLHFFKIRCCNRAQWEIRELANRMLELVYPIAPNLFAKAGRAA